jgi:hypothetical protein
MAQRLIYKCNKKFDFEAKRLKNSNSKQFNTGI